MTHAAMTHTDQNRMTIVPYFFPNRYNKLIPYLYDHGYGIILYHGQTFRLYPPDNSERPVDTVYVYNWGNNASTVTVLQEHLQTQYSRWRIYNDSPLQSKLALYRRLQESGIAHPPFYEHPPYPSTPVLQRYDGLSNQESLYYFERGDHVRYQPYPWFVVEYIPADHLERFHCVYNGVSVRTIAAQQARLPATPRNGHPLQSVGLLRPLNTPHLDAMRLAEEALRTSRMTYGAIDVLVGERCVVLEINSAPAVPTWLRPIYAIAFDELRI